MLHGLAYVRMRRYMNIYLYTYVRVYVREELKWYFIFFFTKRRYFIGIEFQSR